MITLVRHPQTRESRRRSKAERRRLRPRWPYWTPVLVSFVILFFPFLLVRAISAVVGIGLVIIIGRHPVGALKSLLVLVPFHQLVMAGLYRVGVPAELVRALAQWKELIIAGLLVTGIRIAVRERHRLDWLDRLALAYVALGTVYLIMPGFFIGSAVGSTADSTTRLLGWRTDVMYVALFLACRHIRFERAATARLTRAFVVTAIVVAAIGYLEFFASSTWNSFVMETLQFWRYKLEVLQLSPIGDRYFFDIRVYTSVAGRDVLRPGSVLLQYWALAFYSVIAAAVFAGRIARGVAERWEYLGLALAGGIVLLTETRSAVFGLGVVLVVTLLRRSDRSARARGARVRFSLVVAGIAVVAVPLAIGIGLVSRFSGEDDYSSNDSHRNSFENSVDIIVEQPFGRGLATAAGAGQRSSVEGVNVTESQYLQIGTQLGVLGLGLWIGAVAAGVVVMGAAVRRAPPGTDTALVTAMRTALIGLAAGGLFLQVFIDFSLSWAVWGLGGAALGAIDAATGPAPPAGPSLADGRESILR
ncbi:MAG: O-antigen ligase family protein [Actinomycetota bacterium]|nr:O-antigen ligase family protein [Acidimicrobiia bacterium]MDQ3293504.1 O-antigen ligase family protein [Actinomycetota bacterium]